MELWLKQLTRAQLAPAVDTAASSTRERTASNLTTNGDKLQAAYSVRLNTCWEMDLFGRIRILKVEALAQYFSLEQTRTAAEMALVSQVAIQYLAILGGDAPLTVTRSTLENAQESSRITKLQQH